MRPIPVLGVFGLGLTLFACTAGTPTGVGGADGGSTDSTDSTSSRVSSQAEQANGRCPSSPEKLTGTASPGATCSTFADCKPTCCSCTSSGYLAAACVDGVCAGKDSACGRSRAAFCEGSAPPSAPTSNPSGSSSSAPPPPPPPAGSQCVAGDSYSCQYTAKGTWTGSVCCVGSALTCVAGDSYSCQYTAHGAWTGSVCCVDGVSTCTSGSSYDCQYVAKGKWTGSQCCL